MRYASIRSLDTSNGEGVGVSLFVQGCQGWGENHEHCKNCFNPQTWDFNGGKEWTKETEDKFIELMRKPYIDRVTLLGGEPLATQNLDDVLHLVQRIKKEFNTLQHIVYDNEYSHNILNKNDNEIRLSFGDTKTIWLYTGYDFEDIEYWGHVHHSHPTQDADDWRKRLLIIQNVDVLVDGRYEEDKHDISLAFRGSSNQRVIDVKKSLGQNKIVLHCE